MAQSPAPFEYRSSPSFDEDSSSDSSSESYSSDTFDSHSDDTSSSVSSSSTSSFTFSDVSDTDTDTDTNTDSDTDTDDEEVGIPTVVVRSVEKQFWKAAKCGRLDDLKVLHASHGPVLDVNWMNPRFRHWTALHIACYQGGTEVIRFLLSLPQVDVNLRGMNSTPLCLASKISSSQAAQLLVLDPRVDVNKRDLRGRSPLFLCVYYNCPIIVRWLLRCDRLNESSVSEVIRGMENKSGRFTVPFLERFVANPVKARFEAALALRLPSALAAETYAMVVFFSDGLLSLRALPSVTAGEDEEESEWQELLTAKAQKFFMIASRLPLELQMLLCNQVHNSTHEVILSADSEPAFSALATLLTTRPEGE